MRAELQRCAMRRTCCAPSLPAWMPTASGPPACPARGAGACRHYSSLPGSPPAAPPRPRVSRGACGPGGRAAVSCRCRPARGPGSHASSLPCLPCWPCRTTGRHPWRGRLAADRLRLRHGLDALWRRRPPRPAWAAVDLAGGGHARRGLRRPACAPGMRLGRAAVAAAAAELPRQSAIVVAQRIGGCGRRAGRRAPWQCGGAPWQCGGAPWQCGGAPTPMPCDRCAKCARRTASPCAPPCRL